MIKTKLVKPSSDYKETFISYAKEFSGSDNYRIYKNGIENFEEYLISLDNSSKGINIEVDWVSTCTYWMIDDSNELLGIIRIRPSKDLEILKYAGNIGYDIRPSKRKLGYGSRILELGLIKAKEFNLYKVLITCDETNRGSIKIIENNAGEYDSTLDTDKKIAKLRYFISL